MRIGIFGGTFNPPHIGHIAAAEQVVAELELDKVIFIPTGLPPHKELPEHAPSAEHRLSMLRFAIGTRPWAEISDLEIRRPGRSYTADTLLALRTLYPEDELWLLMGTDMFLMLQSWSRPNVIFENARIGFFHRGEIEEEGERTKEQQRYLEQNFGAAIDHILIHEQVVSSTKLRELLPLGKGKSMIAPPVYGYILRNALYGCREDLRNLSKDDFCAVACSYLKPKRIPHVLGTAEEGDRLARRWGADPEKVRIAALLHDCTKALTMEEQLQLCAEHDILLDSLEQRALKLLHAKTGAALAKTVFGVSDDIYEAIYYHTTGRAGMSLLEKIVYLADYIEPTRKFDGVDRLRKAAYEDLDKALLLGAEMTICEMAEMGNPVHRNTLELRDWLKGV